MVLIERLKSSLIKRAAILLGSVLAGVAANFWWGQPLVGLLVGILFAIAAGIAV